ncbi:YhgE/Pip domain-containing protein [Paenibacillus larvae]
MKNTGFFTKEWAAIFKNKKVLISICVIALIPLLYSSMFLWAFWDPYGKLNELPVAVVNMDKGANFEGKELHVGDEFVDKIKESKNFKWDFVSQEKAIQGMDDNKYYMTVVVPENFSEKATKILDEHPTASDLTYIPNESLNFLSSQIGATAVEKMKAELSKNLTKAYAEAMFKSIDKVSDGLAQAADGSLQLKDGSIKIKDGIVQVDENLLKINEGTLTLKDGVIQIYNGLGDLNNGASRIQNEGTSVVASGAGQLADAQKQLSSEGANKIKSGLNDLKSGSADLSDNLGLMEQLAGQKTNELLQLPAGVSKINDTTQKLQTGVNELAKKTPELETGSKAVADGLAKLAQLNPQLAELPQFKQLKKAAEDVANGNELLNKGVNGQSESSLVNGTNGLANGINQLNSTVSEKIKKGEMNVLVKNIQKLHQGSTKLSNGIAQAAAGQNEFVKNFNTFGQKLNELSAGAKQVDGKMNELISGSAKLKDGTSQVSGGVDQLTDGTNQLRTEGTEKLDKGADTLVEGQTELTDKLKEAADKTGDVKGDDSNYNMFAEPVKVTEEKRGPVPNYGTGFAPYFVSLGLFVGALMLTIVFPIKNPVTPPKSAFGWFLSKFSSMLLVGTVQAILVDAILLYGLKIEVQNVGYFFLFSLITSWVFMAILQFLVTAFSDAGRFIAIILLILQLTTSAGTFPLELIPTPLQKFNALVPMTYSVSGYKAVISSGNYSQMWHSALVLGCTIVAFGLLTYAVLAISFKKHYSNLPGNREESVTA